MPGATPSSLVVALGKDGNAYLVNRDNLGGIAPPVASLHLTNSFIINAAASYRTKQGTYVAYRVNGSNLAAFRINRSQSACDDHRVEREPKRCWVAFRHIH